MKGAELNNQEKTARSGAKLDSLVLLLTKVYVGAMVVVVGLAVLGYFMVAGLVEEASREQSVEAHQRLLQQLEQRLDDYIRPVEILAADPQLYEQIAMPDVLGQRQQELANVIGAQSIMLIPAGEEKWLLGDFPLLSYAELDLIHMAQNGQAPGVEFHHLNQGQSHIDVVRPVVREDGVVGKIIVGYILVRYDSKAFLDRLQELFRATDRVELSQALSDGSSQRFMGWGEEALKGLAPAHSGAVKNSSWQLSYWQSPRDWQVQGMSWRVFYWMLSAGVLVVLAVALAVLWRLVDSRTRASANKIYEYVWDRINGHWMGKNYLAELSEVQPTLTRLQNLNWSLATGVKDVVADETAAEPLSDPSYANLLYQDSAVIEVEEVAMPTLEKRAANPDVPASIFRAYDIRGIVGETLTPDVVYDIGRAFGSEAKAAGAQTIVVGRDGRGSSMALSSALIQGLCDAGRDVIDIGQVPTPVLYFATHYLSARSGIMVTGSHNPAEYNGLKLVLQG
jgi:phosphomannomutase/phosphoglucomutase